MLIILGLDSLDAHRLVNHETPTIDSFIEQGLMETPADLDPDQLITGYLWPSMLVGEHPRELFPGHYKAIDSEKESLNSWNNYLLDSAPFRKIERLMVERLSRQKKDQIKRIFSLLNIEQEKQAPKVLDERGSLLDAAENPKLISIPGINPDNSNTKLKSMVADHAEKSGKTTKTDAETFERVAAKADIDRLIRTLSAINSRQYDLVFAHFYSLDLIQHLWVGSNTKMDRWYFLYDRFVSQVLQESADDDTIILVSDHGMQKTGIHSTRAFYASTKDMWGEEPYRLTGLKEVLEMELSQHKIKGQQENGSIDISEETQDHLETLGYF